MKKIDVSVIVPCYNIENYVKRCIESLINQKTQFSYEIILIDDGSTDKTSAICDSFFTLSNIHIIHQVNGGLSNARNKGISLSKGEYITFVDGDDFVSENYIEDLLKSIKMYSSDVSIVNFYLFNEKTSKYKMFSNSKNKCYSSDDALKTMLYQKNFDVSAWGKMYKKELFNDILYPDRMLYEDNGTTYRVISKAKRISFCSTPDYYYCTRPNSIMTSAFNVKKMDGFYLCEKMLDYFNNQGSSVIYSAKSKFISVCFDLILQIKYKNQFKDEYKLLLFAIRKYRFSIICNPRTRFKNKIACFLSFFGINVVKFFNQLR